MSRSLLVTIVVSVTVFTVGQTGPALTHNLPQIPDTTSQLDARGAAGGRDGSPIPRRGAVLISGKLVPAEQLEIDEADPETCDARHIHPRNGSSVTAFDGTVIPDPAPFGCGYSNLFFITPYRVFVTILQDDDFDGLPAIADADDQNPDVDGDWVPDGAEDTDGDGLTDAWEYWVSRTDPRVPDSNGNGNDDSVDHTLSLWNDRFVTIEVMVNLYTGACSDEEADEAIEKANIVLKRARVRLVRLWHRYDVTTGDDGSGGGTANDGILTEEEFRRAAEAWRLELPTWGLERGLKIAFAEIAPNGQYAAGASLRRVPVIAVASRSRNSDEIGASIAHGFFRTAGIDGDPVPGSPEDTEGNIMRPFDDGRDDFVNSNDPDKGIENLTLTPGQLEIVLGQGIPSLYGLPGTRRSPAVKREYQRGSAVDDLGDSTGPGHLDIHTIDIASHTDDEDIHILLVLGDRFPDTGDVDAVYRLRFDIDDDISTGGIAEILGVDRTITIFVERNGGTGGLVIGAEVYSFDPAGSTLLAPTPQLLAVERIADMSTIPNLDVLDLFELHVPKDLLGLTAAIVPTSVSSSEGATSLASDFAFVEFNRELWLNDPTLSVPVEYADRGELVPFSLTGLTPGDSYELLLDDTLVHSGTLDAFGDDAGDFTVPVAQPYDFCFLTAVDDSGQLAASALVVADAIFRDGFETGNSSLWSATVP